MVSMQKTQPTNSSAGRTSETPATAAQSEGAKMSATGLVTSAAGCALMLEGSNLYSGLQANIASEANGITLERFWYTHQQISGVLMQTANSGYVDGIVYGAGLALLAAGLLKMGSDLLNVLSVRFEKAIDNAIQKFIAPAAFILSGLGAQAGAYRLYTAVTGNQANIQFYNALSPSAGWIQWEPGMYSGLLCPGPTTANCWNMASYTPLVGEWAYQNGINTAFGLAMLIGGTYIFARIFDNTFEISSKLMGFLRGRRARSEKDQAQT